MRYQIWSSDILFERNFRCPVPLDVMISWELFVEINFGDVCIYIYIYIYIHTHTHSLLDEFECPLEE